jgi:hypothetical protein
LQQPMVVLMTTNGVIVRQQVRNKGHERRPRCNDRYRS